MTDDKNALENNGSISEAYEKLWERIFEYITKLKGENNEQIRYSNHHSLFYDNAYACCKFDRFDNCRYFYSLKGENNGNS